VTSSFPARSSRSKPKSDVDPTPVLRLALAAAAKHDGTDEHQRARDDDD